MSNEEGKLIIDLPRGLRNFINGLIKEGLFNNVEEFVLHATRILAELYGLPGEPILKKILSQLDLGISSKRESLSEHEQMILDAFGKSKFMYEEELFMLTRKEAMLRKIPPLSKENFSIVLENLIKKGLLERIKHGNEVMIRKKEE